MLLLSELARLNKLSSRAFSTVYFSLVSIDVAGIFTSKNFPKLIYCTPKNIPEATTIIIMLMFFKYFFSSFKLTKIHKNKMPNIIAYAVLALLKITKKLKQLINNNIYVFFCSIYLKNNIGNIIAK